MMKRLNDGPGNGRLMRNFFNSIKIKSILSFQKDKEKLFIFFYLHDHHEPRVDSWTVMRNFQLKFFLVFSQL